MGVLSSKLGDAALRRTFASVLAAGIVLTALGAALRGRSAAVSVGVGTVLAVANLYVLARVVHALAVPAPRANAGAAWAVITVGKIMLLFGLAWGLMTWRMADPIPLVVGYGALPIGIAFAAIVSEKTDPRAHP